MEGPRGVQPHELDAVVQLADDIFMPEGRQMGPQFPTLFCAENAEWLRTFWDAGRPVSLVGVWRGEAVSWGRRLPVAHVGSVCTRPEYRGRGLAGALLLDAMRRLQAAGTALLLISGDRALYRRAGARPRGDLRLCTLEAHVAALAAAAAGEVHCEAPPAADPALLGDMARLYAAEPVHYTRSPQDWRLLLPARCLAVPGGVRGAVVVRRRGAVAAYLLWTLGWRLRPPEDPEVPLQVEELAGERAAVAAGIAFALRATGRRRANVRLQPGDEALERWGELGATAADAPTHHTARVLDVEALVGALAAVPGPGPAPDAVAPLRPTAPLGSPEEADQAARLSEVVLGPGGLPLPSTYGLNYI